MEVAHALKELGYQIEPQVGTAGYFIDMAVKDPEYPGRYILAIECDGASYHSSRSARDRDRLRQGVLESLGWRFHRIWSTDWFRDAKQQIDRTVVAIEAARVALSLNQPVRVSIETVAAPVIERVEADKDDSVSAAMAYRKATIPTSKLGQALHEVPVKTLATMIKVVTDIEAPVHELDVTRRLMEAFGVTRAGSRITESVRVAVQHGHAASMFHHHEGFVYADKGRLAKPRNRNVLEPTERKIELVAPEELDQALLDVVRMGYSISEDAAVSGALDLLGFGRATSNIAGAMKGRLSLMQKKGRIKRVDDKIVAV
jgi:very-short-patch-repair endonuclease